MLVAFCVQHDANHGASFGSRRYNRIVGFSADAMLGFSSYAWRVKHNVAHHTYTNVDAYDDDISQVPLARLLPAQSSRPWYRLQHFYIWPMYSLMVLRMQAFGDVAALVRGRIGRSKLRMPRGWDLAGIVSGKLVYLELGRRDPALHLPVVGRRRHLHRRRDGRRAGHRDHLPARALRRRGELSLERRARRRHDRLGGPPDRVDGRLLPAQPGADLGARRAQLPDRAPPLPAPPPHPVPARSPASCAPAPSRTACATPVSRRSGARSARTRATCARWAAAASRPRSRWASRQAQCGGRAWPR